MTPREHGRLRLWVLLTALVVALAVPVGAAWMLQGWAHARLTDGLLEHAHEVQREIRDTVAYAAELGIPLDAEDVVHSGFAYLGGVLRDNPQVRFIAVARPPSETGLFFYEGTNRARLAGLLADPSVAAAASVPGGSGEQALPLGNFAILVEPLALADGTPFAVLYVGIDRRFAEAQLATVTQPLALAVLAGLVLAIQAALFAVDGLLVPPLDRLAAKLAGPDLVRTPRRRGERRPDEVSAVLRAHGAAADRLQDAYGRLLTYADEVRREVFDPAVAEQVAGLRARTEAELSPLFQAAESTPPAVPVAQRQLAVFCFAGAVTAPVADAVWRSGAAGQGAWLSGLTAVSVIGALLLAGQIAKNRWARDLTTMGAVMTSTCSLALWFTSLASDGPPWAWAAGGAIGLALVVLTTPPRMTVAPLILGGLFGGLLSASLAEVAGSAVMGSAAGVLAVTGLVTAIRAVRAGP